MPVASAVSRAKPALIPMIRCRIRLTYTSTAHSADDHAPHSSFNHCPHTYRTTIPTQQIDARAPYAAQRPKPLRKQFQRPDQVSTCCPKVCQASPAGAGSQQSRAWPGRVPYMYRYATSFKPLTCSILPQLHCRTAPQQPTHAECCGWHASSIALKLMPRACQMPEPTDKYHTAVALPLMICHDQK